MRGSFGLLLALACALPARAAATEDFSRFWGGFDAGYASLARSYSVTEATTQGKFTMALRGGIALAPGILVGVELGGWTIQGADMWDPATGEAISTRFLIAQVYPLARRALFVRGGGGRVEYWNHRPGENGASGSAGIVGLGWDFPLGAAGFYVTPSIDYSRGGYDGATSPPGVVQDQRYRALSIRLGVTFR
jgi:hypothetical protein